MTKTEAMGEVRIWITLSPSDILAAAKAKLTLKELAKDILEELLGDLLKAKKISDHDLWEITVEVK